VLTGAVIQLVKEFEWSHHIVYRFKYSFIIYMYIYIYIYIYNTSIPSNKSKIKDMVYSYNFRLIKSYSG
jgi:hypothetical protein